jgi:hypothetical protein
MDSRRDVPPHISNNDLSEEKVAKLIEKMKRQYKRYFRSIANEAAVDW